MSTFYTRLRCLGCRVLRLRPIFQYKLGTVLSSYLVLVVHLTSEKAVKGDTQVMGTSSRPELAASFPSERTTAPTILIVDDEDSTRNLCRDVITDSGLRTRVASTTEQALEILD
jgi:PleD family two-component response regulator